MLVHHEVRQLTEALSHLPDEELKRVISGDFNLNSASLAKLVRLYGGTFPRMVERALPADLINAALEAEARVWTTS